MNHPVKIWNRILDAFCEVEMDGVAVESITIPSGWLKVIEKEPTEIGFFGLLGYVENPRTRNRKIWGARVKIGGRFACN